MRHPWEGRGGRGGLQLSRAAPPCASTSCTAQLSPLWAHRGAGHTGGALPLPGASWDGIPACSPAHPLSRTCRTLARLQGCGRGHQECRGQDGGRGGSDERAGSGGGAAAGQGRLSPAPAGRRLLHGPCRQVAFPLLICSPRSHSSLPGPLPIHSRVHMPGPLLCVERCSLLVGQQAVLLHIMLQLGCSTAWGCAARWSSSGRAS